MNKPADYLRLLDIASRAARAAAAVILEIYAAPFEVREKTDASPVTEADERSERIIHDILRQAAPDIPVIAEEQVSAAGAPQAIPARFWLVDPLDGTREFVAKRDEFTVNIGLVENGRPVLGVVHLPARDVAYRAAGFGTATRQRNAMPPEAIAARRPLARPVVVHSRSHANDERIATYLAGLPGAEIHISGSAAKFCFLAEGSADYYPRFGTTMEWDTAAGQAILEAAGGSVVTLDGAPLSYGKPDFRNPHFIARGAQE
jgi:3'(2'), 5'-bisphosphate nucleotidase